MSFFLRVAAIGFVLTFPGIAAQAWAQEPVFLRGHLVTPQHVVFGKVESLRGEMAIINLGYAHGLRTTATLLAVRRVSDELIPIAGLTVLATEANHARARVEGPFQVEANDFVMIHASRLNLWGGTSRLDRMASEQIVRRQNSAGYSTFNTDEELIEEVARDDEYRGRQYQGRSLESIRSEAIDKAGALKLQIGAVAPLQTIERSTESLVDVETQQMDATLLALSYFAENARSRNLMLPRMSTDRLQQLQTVGTALDVEEQTAPLFREVLLTWIAKTIQPQ